MFLPIVAHRECLHDAPLDAVLDRLRIVVSLIIHGCSLLLLKTLELTLDTIQILNRNFQSFCLVIVLLLNGNLLLGGQQSDLLGYFGSANFSLWCH